MIDERRLYQEIGERLRERRLRPPAGRAPLTQASLAALVGLERTSITNIESGAQKLPLHTLMRICESLGTSVADVVPPMREVVASAPRAAHANVDEVRENVVKALPLLDRAVSSVLNSQENG